MNKRRLLFQYIGITLLLIFITIVILMFMNIIFIVLDIPIIIGKKISDCIASIFGFLVIKALLKNIRVIDHISISKLDIKIIISVITFFSSLSIVYNNFFIWFISQFKLSPNVFIDNTETVTNEYSSLLGLILGLVSVAIVIPIIEELYFRVLSIEFLKKDFSIVISVIISSIVFSIAHLSKIQNSIELFITAIFLAVIYIKTKNAFYSIIAHMTHNALYVIFNYCMNNNILIFNQNIMVKFNNLQVFSERLCVLSIFLMVISFSCLMKSLRVKLVVREVK